MRPIPEDLLAKLKLRFQTQHNDADPQIHLIFQRAERFIEEGGILDPYTIATGDPPLLRGWDLAMRRTDRRKNPDYMYRAMIADGTVTISRTPYPAMIGALRGEPHELMIDWEYLGTVGSNNSLEVAIEFDGFWVRVADDAEVCFDSPANWTHITAGEPYIFWTDTAGKLWAQQLGQGPHELTPSGTTKICAIRGWKSVVTTWHDQGLIVVYTRDGTLRYRNYAEQNTDPPTWGWEHEKNTTKAAVNVGIARTNDYRTAILYETPTGEIHWLVTTRNWSGMAIPPHTIEAKAGAILVELLPIIETTGHEDHSVTASAGAISCMLCPPIWPVTTGASNPAPTETTTINITCSIDLFGDLVGLQAGFLVRDGLLTNFPVTATAKGLTPGIIRLTTASFGGAQGDLTITYTHAAAPIFAQVTGGCRMELDSFVRTFTPLVPLLHYFTDETIAAIGTGLELGFHVITNVNGTHRKTVTATAGAISVVLTWTGGIDP